MIKWTLLVPPVVVPLSIWMFVALAGPGGLGEVPRGVGLTPVAEVGPDGAGADSTPSAGDVDVGDGDVGDGNEAGGDDTGNADADSTENGGDGSGCEEALSERAQARPGLEEHAADGDMPATGAEGNENALDKQCGGAFAEDSEAETTPAAGQTATGPGKSEQAPGAPDANGQARGRGQSNADDNGNGPANAPGQNKP